MRERVHQKTLQQQAIAKKCFLFRRTNNPFQGRNKKISKEIEQAQMAEI
jgi:hypothetical protein